MGSIRLWNTAYPSGLVGWLVLVLRRHAAAAHELMSKEFAVGKPNALGDRILLSARRHAAAAVDSVVCLWLIVATAWPD